MARCVWKTPLIPWINEKTQWSKVVCKSEWMGYPLPNVKILQNGWQVQTSIHTQQTALYKLNHVQWICKWWGGKECSTADRTRCFLILNPQMRKNAWRRPTVIQRPLCTSASSCNASLLQRPSSFFWPATGSWIVFRLLLFDRLPASGCAVCYPVSRWFVCEKQCWRSSFETTVASQATHNLK